jgi:hypothetical protein
MNLPQFFTAAAKVIGGGGGGLSDSPDNYANLKGWWKADAYSGSDGDLVSTWLDSSGNSNDATASSTARPTYKTGIYNSKACMRFNGTTNILTLATVLKPTAWDGAWSAMAVGLVSSANLSNAWFGGASSGDYVLRQSYGGSNNRITIRILSLGSGDRTSQGFGNTNTDLTAFGWTMGAGAAGPTAYEGKTTRGTQGSYEDLIQFNRIGADGGSMFYPWTGDLCELCFWQTDMAANMTSLYDNYFKPKWGLP